MLPTLKRLTGLVLISMATLHASAFSLLGPAESWQTPTVNFGDRFFLLGGSGSILRFESDTRSFAVITFGGNPIFSGTVDIGGSKNIGEEYRLNTPIITYAYDASFLDYFGTSGVKAIDQAMAILNKLPKVSAASADLSEFLTENNQRINQRAQALQLIDLKSTVLALMMERMGLMGEEHVFDIHSRIPTPVTCNFDYITVMRNFDPVTWEPSRYVNGTLYTYIIKDGCPAAISDAIEETVDEAGFKFTAVATQAALQYGGFYLGITRDDMGGLRYLYRHDNYNNETLPTNSISRGSASTWAPIAFGGTNATFSSNSVALRGGIEKITFVKTSFSSLLGNSFKPMTINYTLQKVTNYSIRSESITRTITRPDILFKAADLTSGGGGFLYPSAQRTGGGYATVTVGDPLTSAVPDGPGIISPQASIVFNKMGPAFLNSTPFFLDEVTATPGFVWGSFDGSTNDPVVYPSGTSIRDMELQVLSAPLVPAPGTTFNPAGF